MLFPEQIGPWHWLADTHHRLSQLFLKLNQPAEAEKALRLAVEIYDVREVRFPRGEHSESERLAAYHDLGQLDLAARRYTEAEAPLRICLTISEKLQPDAWTTFNTKSLLGRAMLGQKKYADAEPLLLAGYEGMKQQEKTVPPQSGTRLPETLDRLIELSSATNRPDEVKKWQAEGAKYPATYAKPPEKK